jgi:hypothetical protein
MVWKASKQSTILTSITETKIIAFAVITRKAIAFHKFYKKLYLNLGECWKIYCDNQQIIRLIRNDQMRITIILKYVNI